MNRHQWADAWRFARQHFDQIERGDLWGLLTAAQKLAAIALDARQHQPTTPAHKLALPF